MTSRRNLLDLAETETEMETGTGTGLTVYAVYVIYVDIIC